MTISIFYREERENQTKQRSASFDRTLRYYAVKYNTHQQLRVRQTPLDAKRDASNYYDVIVLHVVCRV